MEEVAKLEYHLLLGHDLEILAEPDYQRLNESVIEVKRMLTAFIKKLKTNR
ncbi:MAG: four helix bundle protein [Anaerolineae bacterium]|nr:four helix bundle protein [Anaerolineae bacterium]